MSSPLSFSKLAFAATSKPLVAVIHDARKLNYATSYPWRPTPLLDSCLAPGSKSFAMKARTCTTARIVAVVEIAFFWRADAVCP